MFYETVRKAAAYKLIWLGLAALVLRLVLIPVAAHPDLLTQADWGKWMYLHGINGLYAANVWRYEWPNHPPLTELHYVWAYDIQSVLLQLFDVFGTFIAMHHLGAGHLVWFFRFVQWFGTATIGTTGILWGIVASIKLFAIGADLALAGLIYAIAKRLNSPRPLLYPALYLFLPFSWYLSAVWGQSDGIATVLLVLAFLAIIWKRPLIVPLLCVCAFFEKPTVIFFFPLLLFVYIRYKPAILSVVRGIGAALLLAVWSLWIFQHANFGYFVFSLLPHRLFFTKFPFTVVSALNFWHIFYLKGTVGDTVRILGLDAKWWGYLFFIILNLFAFAIASKRTIGNTFAAMVVVGIGSWLLLTNMYERYEFAGIVSLLLLALSNRSFLKYWLCASSLFWINLFYGWWFPPQLDFLRQVMLWHQSTGLRIIALANTVLFFWICYRIYRVFAVQDVVIAFRQKLPLLKAKQPAAETA